MYCIVLLSQLLKVIFFFFAFIVWITNGINFIIKAAPSYIFFFFLYTICNFLFIIMHIHTNYMHKFQVLRVQVLKKNYFLCPTKVIYIYIYIFSWNRNVKKAPMYYIYKKLIYIAYKCIHRKFYNKTLRDHRYNRR